MAKHLHGVRENGAIDILEDSEIGAIWQICFVANSFTHPIYANFDKSYGISRMEFVVLYAPYCARWQSGGAPLPARAPPGVKSSAPFAILHLCIQGLRIAAPLPGVIQACRKDTCFPPKRSVTSP